MSRPNSSQKGFTLIEVLVALAIVSIGMLVVIQAVSQTVNNTAYLRDKTLAHWVAMNQMTMMRISQTVPSVGTSSAEVEMAGQRFKWSAEVSQTAVDSIFKIDIGVRAADADESSQLTSVTGFIGTKISKPGTLVAQYTPAISTVTGRTTTTTTPVTPPPNRPGLPTVPPISPTPRNDPDQPLISN